MYTADLYEVLGVARDAPPRDIEDAYRRLKDNYARDPASVGGEAGLELIEDAYAILSDPFRRFDYNHDMDAARHGGGSAGGVGGQVESIHCQTCDVMPVQPRYLVFWRVFSLILFTNRSPVQGVYCAPCARKAALGASAFTGVLGWWGLPWGPIWTLWKGFQNVTGGEKPHGVSEGLAWQNVLAFAHMGDMASAQAGAQHLLASRDEGTSSAAQGFLDQCRRDGVPPVPAPEDAWKLNVLHLIARVLAWMIVPIALVILVSLADSPRSDGYDPYYDSAAPTYSGADSIAPLAANVPTCASEPATGAILAGGEGLAAEGEGHELEIANGSANNAVVNLRDSASNALRASFYIRRGETGKLAGLPDGTYRIQYAMGDALDEACRMFAGDFAASQFPGTEVFAARYVNDAQGEGYIYQVVTYTLYSTPDGTVQPEGISDDAFTVD